jgi:hypothetical protein
MGWSFVTVVIEEGKKMAESSNKENLILPHEYGCEVLLEKTTIEKAKDTSFPNDAYLIWYVVDDKQHIDLVRCHKKVNLFDMYYDKYGPGAVQKIDFGYGRTNPRLWGYKEPEKKKRK